VGLLIQPRAETYADPYDRDNPNWLQRFLTGGEESDSGIAVNESTAIKNPIIWKCVNWRAKMFGMLPKKLKERTELFGRPAQIEAQNHPLFPLLHTAPNPTITSAAWFGLISADLHLWGNSYALIERGSATGRIRALWRLRPDMVRVCVEYSEIVYYVRDDHGGEKRFGTGDILHIRGLGFDGIQGYSPIRMMMQTIGWSGAARRYGAQFFKKASRPSFLAIAPAAIGDPKKKQELIKALTMSGREAGQGLLIEGAMEIKPLTMPQDEAQFVETIQMQDEDIAGVMEVKPHEIGIMRNMTNNNVEQETISSVTRCLQPFAIGVEQWLDLQLLSDAPSSGRGGGTERDRFFVQCELKVLLRGDTAAQTAHIIAMRDRGIYSGNDCADYLGLPSFEGGDVRVINRAYGPIDMIREWSMTSQNNPPSTTGGNGNSDSAEGAKSSFSRIFRDAVGRTINRKQDRHGFVVMTFEPILSGIAANLNVDDPVFITGYLGAMGERSATWDKDNADRISTEELTRVVDALIGRN